MGQVRLVRQTEHKEGRHKHRFACIQGVCRCMTSASNNMTMTNTTGPDLYVCTCKQLIQSDTYLCWCISD